DKPYACDQCELTFSRQHNLKSHALTHSTERPFSCNVCHTPFRRQHDLKRHMKLHTGEKPYKCTNCERSFARLDALNRHMRAENFHACNQAAKKARTSVMVLDRASRLKSGSSASASVAYLEQRRASTTTTAAHHQYPPPGSSPSVSGGGGLTSVAGAHAPSKCMSGSARRPRTLLCSRRSRPTLLKRRPRINTNPPRLHMPIITLRLLHHMDLLAIRVHTDHRSSHIPSIMQAVSISSSSSSSNILLLPLR
ncbi:hypothetical protein GGI22_008097, partial [Coemansia erecta]